MSDVSVTVAKQSSSAESAAWFGRSAWRLLTPWAAVPAVVLSLHLTGEAPRPVPEGLPDAGAMTGWALPLLRAALHITGATVVGLLLAAAFLLDGSEGGLGAPARRAAAGAGRAATAWSVLAWLLYTAVTSEALGVPLGTLLVSPGLLSYGLELPDGRALAALALVALVVGLNAGSLRRRRGAGLMLALAVGSMLPLLLTGHAATSSAHYLATQALVVHVIAVTLWLGGLLALVTTVWQAPELAAAARRFSLVAGVCFVGVSVSGLVLALTLVGGDLTGLHSPYGALLATKAVVLVSVGAAGWWHRSRTLPALARGAGAGFVRLAVGEALLLASTIGVAAGLSRTPSPAVAPTAGPVHGGDVGVVANLPPISLTAVLTNWRPDVVVVSLLLLAAGTYLWAVEALRRTGRGWPVRRTVAMLAGVTLALLLLCSGVAVYASALLSVQAAQVLTLALTVPMLLTLGRPITLARQVSHAPSSHSPAAWTRALADPVNGLVILVTLLTLLYATPLLGWCLSYPLVEHTVGLTALAGGFLFLWPLLALDWTPQPRAARDRLVLSLFACGLFLVVVAAVHRTAMTFEEEWLRDLGLWWSDDGADRRWTLAVVAAHVGLLLGVAGALGRATRRESIEAKMLSGQRCG